MPREMIRSSVGPYNVKVGWSADGRVQLGVECEGERSLFWLLLGGGVEAQARLGAAVRALEIPDKPEGWVPESNDDGSVTEDPDVVLGCAVLDMLDVSAHGTDPVGDVVSYTGLWSHLDRHACNTLVRTLRKARDSAFGKDE